MSTHSRHAHQEHNVEADILMEIRESEKMADAILEAAKKDSESILREAAANSSKLLREKEEEAASLQEKQLVNFRDKAKLIRGEKTAEGNAAVQRLKSISEKNIPAAIEFVLKKFEEMI